MKERESVVCDVSWREIFQKKEKKKKKGLSRGDGGREGGGSVLNAARRPSTFLSHGRLKQIGDAAAATLSLISIISPCICIHTVWLYTHYTSRW